MKINDILGEVGRERGFFVSLESGTLTGMTSGFPTLIRSVPLGRTRAVSITLRTGVGDFAALKKAVKGVKGFRPSLLKKPGEAVQYLIPYSWPFTGKIKAAVTATLDALTPLVAAHFTPPARACEVCGREGDAEVRDEKGWPVLMCPSCAETIRAKREAARMAYEATSPDYLRGIVLGVIGAAIGALAWALVIILLKKTILILTAGVGVLVAALLKKGMGRIDGIGYVIAGVLVLASIFAGDVLSYVWLIDKATGRLNFPMAYHAYLNILLNNPENLVLTVIFALAGVAVGIGALRAMEKNTNLDKLR
jgi:hypothetical protein